MCMCVGDIVIVLPAGGFGEHFTNWLVCSHPQKPYIQYIVSTIPFPFKP